MMFFWILGNVLRWLIWVFMLYTCLSFQFLNLMLRNPCAVHPWLSRTWQKSGRTMPFSSTKIVRSIWNPNGTHFEFIHFCQNLHLLKKTKAHFRTAPRVFHALLGASKKLRFRKISSKSNCWTVKNDTFSDSVILGLQMFRGYRLVVGYPFHFLGLPDSLPPVTSKNRTKLKLFPIQSIPEMDKKSSNLGGLSLFFLKDRQTWSSSIHGGESTDTWAMEQKKSSHIYPPKSV